MSQVFPVRLPMLLHTDSRLSQSQIIAVKLPTQQHSDSLSAPCLTVRQTASKPSAPLLCLPTGADSLSGDRLCASTCPLRAMLRRSPSLLSLQTWSAVVQLAVCLSSDSLADCPLTICSFDSVCWQVLIRCQAIGWVASTSPLGAMLRRSAS